jgi:hypothetical protein
VTKTERWLNLLAFLPDHRSPVTREEILNQVDDYKGDWNSGYERRSESVRHQVPRYPPYDEGVASMLDLH